MKTFYIDVYFLINFTVDILSLYFASTISHVSTTVRRLISASAVGALFACILALFKSSIWIHLLITLASAWLICVITVKDRGAVKYFKLVLSFLTFETLIGGSVTFFYGILERNLGDIADGEIGTENRNALIIALLVALTYFIIKMIIYVFAGSENEKNAVVKIILDNDTVEVNALLDSGNVLLDPMSASRVIIVKRSVMRCLQNEGNLMESAKYKTRIRLIPIRSVNGDGILVGLRCDDILINGNMTDIKIIAIDEEEGSFGGYYAIAPLIN